MQVPRLRKNEKGRGYTKMKKKNEKEGPRREKERFTWVVKQDVCHLREIEARDIRCYTLQEHL